MVPAVPQKWAKKSEQVNQFPIELQSAECPTVLAHLSKREANHKKLLIPLIQKKVNQEDCIGIVAKILRQKQLCHFSFFLMIICDGLKKLWINGGQS